MICAVVLHHGRFVTLLNTELRRKRDLKSQLSIVVVDIESSKMNFSDNQSRLQTSRELSDAVSSLTSMTSGHASGAAAIDPAAPAVVLEKAELETPMGPEPERASDVVGGLAGFMPQK